MRIIFLMLLLFAFPSIYATNENSETAEEYTEQSLCGRLLQKDPAFAHIDRAHLENIMIQRLLMLQPNHPTEITMLMGRSGAGKTQIINAMMSKVESIGAPYIHIPSIAGQERHAKSVSTNIPEVQELFSNLEGVQSIYQILENRTSLEVLLNRIPRSTFIAIDVDWMNNKSMAVQDAIFSLAQAASLTVTTMDPVLKPYLSQPLQDRILIIDLDKVLKTSVVSPRAIAFWGTLDANEQHATAVRIQNVVSRGNRERMTQNQFQQSMREFIIYTLTGDLQLNDWPANSDWFSQMIAELRAHPVTTPETSALLLAADESYKSSK